MEDVWQRYLENHESVSPQWCAYFTELEDEGRSPADISPRIIMGHEQLHQGFGPGGKICADCGRTEAM